MILPGDGPVETVIDERNTLNKKDSVLAWLKTHPHVTRVVICEDEPYRFTDNDVDATVVYIDTDPYKGLTDEQLTEIDEFIEKNY